MKYFSHYCRVIIKIISSSYVDRRTDLLICYLRLVGNSIIHHKLKSRRTSKSGFKIIDETVMGFAVSFFSYSELINLFEEIFIYQIYKFSCVTSSPIILDCGSNIGLSIIYFKTIYPASKILAFEPDDRTFKLLEQNIKRNKLEQVTLLNLALADIDGSASLYKNKSSLVSLNSSLIPVQDSYIEKVQIKRLSDFIYERVEMLKLDVEGSEPQILKDLIERKKIDSINQMIIEFHPNVIHDSVTDYFVMLQKCDLKLYEVKKGPHLKSTDVIAHFINRYHNEGILSTK